jgi:hypothetical protein
MFVIDIFDGLWIVYKKNENLDDVYDPDYFCVTIGNLYLSCVVEII